ncbi:helix-turn-helix transcriptional regulator [Enterococcus sp. BWB1-3]|uniref:helix-turn-helix domain-containing protein n=1 Tax=unclassified Enterococcus TaxID=2608891 RepID=UPI00192053B2|nr:MULTISPECIES: XRE family transcriptional regulator [unclassified Enterococcus]MBL1230019.1 helix-turn-helix transcriptional regulator [Enterococcus sp. BWB1-3]MCB5952419.1 XRE family transcriptional regulator [Enterococcus sp. BWT-B8]MCB5955373.1 XRE family transcriptional regulator [Enterococcus sp. CWB-B31]
MEIGDKLKNLRVQKNLTQEELGERTDLTKGYISQLERDLSSPSMETFFNILEVLGVTPEEFFSEDSVEQKVVYGEQDCTYYLDEENGYMLKWLIPESNEMDMEPVLLTFDRDGEYKTFEPSLSETFIYVLEGAVSLVLGENVHAAKKGEAIYYEASEPHQLKNKSKGKSRVLIVATESYL